MTELSVVLCTYNRCESLKITLKSLAALNAPADAEYEVIIVDNNSSDQTREVVESFSPEFQGRLRCLFEGRQGISFARNTGIQNAKGQIIAFTDDDIEVDPDWLVNLTAAFKAYEADCVYGRILPNWLANRPAWLDQRFWGKLALLDHGDQPFLVTSEDHHFTGANMAMRRDMLLELQGFDVTVGHEGASMRKGDDTAMFFQLLEQGKRILYQPSAVVSHRIPPERMTKRYFRQWQFGRGQGEARMGGTGLDRSVYGIPFWVLSKWFRSVAVYFASFMGQDRSTRLLRELRIRYYLGFCAERIVMWKEGRNGPPTS